TALHVPPVVTAGTAGVGAAVSIEVLAVDAVVPVGAECAAVAHAPEALLFIAAAGGYQPAGRAGGMLGDDVDHAIDGIRSPQRPSRAAHDLDAFDVFKEDVLHLPVDAGEQRR